MLDLYAAITQADCNLIEQLLNLVLYRYEELYPDWEISTVSVQKSTDQNEQLDRMIAALQAMKRIP